ncbi:MAG: zinc finger Ran-binding domain-containing protein [Planctomycetes bacterium]|nr:zinc finger Ran-binding domain-containing protein [Planctomycetota bacterium]
MSCPRCGFFNFPGSPACVSCGTPLGHAAGAVAIATAPPRATSLQKRMRRARKVVLGTDVALETRTPRPSLALFALLPGLPQVIFGYNVLALVFATAWAASLALATWLFGSPFSPWFVGGAIGTHFMSAVHPWRAPVFRMGFRDRTLLTLTIYLLLAGGIYWPAFRIAGQHVIPLAVHDIRPNPVFHTGDSVLIRPLPASASPAAGSLVAFTIGNGAGLVIDRVLGLPGDRIQWQAGTWKRNSIDLGPGEVPLTTTAMPRLIDFVVPENALFIWPSANPYFGRFGDPIAETGLVSSKRIAGTAWRFASPFRRRGPVESR